MMKSGIYAIINIVTGKSYVGQAFNIKKRWTNHEVELRLQRHVNPYLQASWNKWTEHLFIFIVLEHCEIEALTIREQAWMDKLKAADREFGYNYAPAAGSLLGFKASPETLIKLAARSAKLKGIPRTQEVKDKIGVGHKGKVVSKETREKMRLARLGKKHSAETKALMSEQRMGNTANLGRKQSPEEIEIRRKANTGKKRVSTFGEAVAARNRARTVSAETKELMRQAALRRWRKISD